VLVKEAMKREVSVVGPDLWLALAACIMRDQDLGCLPVIEDGVLVGVVTDRDVLVRGVAEGLDPHRAIVREGMSVDAVTCSVEDTVEQVTELMTTKLIKHLAVLDRRKRLVGLVALRDLTGEVAKCRPHRVTFCRRLPSSSGHVHNVEVGKHLSPAVSQDEILPAALARLEQDRGLARWQDAADLYEVEGSG
jgi:CBS domain-containing protein